VASLTRGRPHNAHTTAKINKVKDRTLIFCVVRISISLAILCEICIQIGYFFLRVMQEKQKWVVFSKHGVHYFNITFAKQ